MDENTKKKNNVMIELHPDETPEEFLKSFFGTDSESIEDDISEEIQIDFSYTKDKE